MGGNRKIGTMRGTCTVTYEVELTRGQAIEYLEDAGADLLFDLMPDAELLAALADDEAPHVDEVRDFLNDAAVEVDSSSTEWEVQS